MSALRAALAALSALVAFATLPTDAEVLLNNPFYLTVLHKGMPWSDLNESVGPLYIPVDQCSGVLDKLLQSKEGRALRAVRVRVNDGAFVQVTLDNDLRRSNVMRSDCTAEAIVYLDLSCTQQQQGASPSLPSK